MQFSEQYLEIFNLKPEDCNCIGFREIDTKGRKFRLESIIKAPTDFADCIVDKNLCNRIRNTIKMKKVAGPDIVKKISLKNEKDKKRKFIYTYHIIPENLIEFKIKDGNYYLKMIGFGEIE